MRRPGLACVVLGSLALTSCGSASRSDSPEGPIASAQSPIAYGSLDNAHTAVVALLGNAGGGSFDECSGTIVQVKAGSAYVLTAAHCCNMVAPSIVVMSNDYTVGEQYIFGGAPQPPAYAVTAGSIYYDSNYNGQDHDFCMLKFAAPGGTTVIPVALPGQDGLSLGVQVEHVGFGVTDNSTTNTKRRTGTAPLDQNLTNLILQSSQGGPSHIPGQCEGDSGGPALVPAGVAPAQQKVTGVTSYGNSQTCNQDTIGVCSRVTSETGPGGFISNYLADTPSGTQPGSAAQACTSCVQAAEAGACASQTQTCKADPKCLTLNQCEGQCQDQACITACETTAGATATNELNAFGTCICNTACVSQCASQCGSSSSSSSSSSGGMNCGLMASDPTCNTCLDTACCTQAQACAADPACTACLVASPPPSCNSNGPLTALTNCLNGLCGVQCGGSGSSSASSTSSGIMASTSSSTGSSGSTSTSSGTTSNASTGSGASTGGAGGAQSTGNGSGNGSSVGSGGHSPGAHSGCSVAAGDDPASPGWLAGLLLGAAMVVSRRRR